MAKIDPWKFSKKPEKDELRPNLTGIGYKGGYLYATDAYVMLKQKADYPKRYEGRVVRRDGKPMEGKQPNYESVIPDIRHYTPWKINTEKLRQRVKYAKEKNAAIKKLPRYERWTTPDITTVCLLDHADGKIINGIDLGYAPMLANYLESVGSDTIWIRTDRSPSKAILAFGKDSMLLLMPVLVHSEDDRIDENTQVSVSIRPNENTGISVANPEKQQTQTSKTKTTMKKATRKSTRKAASTMKSASTILKAQKDDYKKIFRAEVKKSKNPNEGAKKAGKIYRDRYGSTAKARWKRALKRAK